MVMLCEITGKVGVAVKPITVIDKTCRRVDCPFVQRVM
ncbi:hypothetical protein A225_1646 [Klebsiella michiganensis E718]|nr:hypothetical protein A225_1646 [Klebsiella michiganensis E718]